MKASTGLLLLVIPFLGMETGVHGLRRHQLRQALGHEDQRKEWSWSTKSSKSWGWSGKSTLSPTISPTIFPTQYPTMSPTWCGSSKSSKSKWDWRGLREDQRKEWSGSSSSRSCKSSKSSWGWRDGDDKKSRRSRSDQDGGGRKRNGKDGDDGNKRKRYKQRKEDENKRHLRSSANKEED